MADITPGMIFTNTLQNGQPQAAAWVRGNAQNPQLSGLVKFYGTPYMGVLIEVEIFGLPSNIAEGSSHFYGMHIHENGDCNPPFDQTGAHYNPGGLPHPDHAGDLIPLLGNQGYAWQSFFDKRFTISEIVGRSVVIHDMSDDFKTQPSGGSSEKIGCGVIRSSDIK